MKTRIIKIMRTLLLAAGTATLLFGAGPLIAQDSWQMRMLFTPPESQLEVEKRGRIMIYDGLKETQIEQVMDTQFDRIESMMFVRTIITNDETDEETVEDDGC